MKPDRDFPSEQDVHPLRDIRDVQTEEAKPIETPPAAAVEAEPQGRIRGFGWPEDQQWRS